MRGSLRALLLIAIVGCAACEKTSEECTKQLSELKDLCPPGSRVSFAAMGSDNASANVKAGQTDKSGSGTYESEGACTVLCEPPPPCPCGIKTQSRDSYECFPLSECAPGCGDGVCDKDEDVDHCGRDCASEMVDESESDSAGSGGKTGSSKGSDAGMSGDDETGGSSDGGSASNGDPSAGSSCIQLVRGRYVVRTDGKLLAENRDKSMETVIGDEDGHPLTDVIDVVGGIYHGCALRMDGTVWCWREHARGNRNGQLADGSTNDDPSAPQYRATQVLVGPGDPLENVKELVRTGGDVESSCALSEDKKMWCWGDLGNLANNGKALAAAYAQTITTDGIEDLTGVLQASFASTMACAVVEESPDNALYCWGVNDYGNLGTGDTTRRQYPTKVTSLTAPSFVSVMAYGYALSAGGTACAIDGEELRCWGANGAGETGTGGTSAVNTPTPVVLMNGTTTLPPPVELIGTSGTFCARLENQTLWCWGALYGANATKYGVTNVAGLGGVFPLATNSHYPIFYTSDGLYHWGMEWARSPKCGAL